ncbi:MAG: type II toxin-antitoxin system HicB family antitoxin [Acidobacteriaceae bacterium]
MKKLLVVFEAAKTGYGAFAPDVPGCISTGKTLEETRSRFIEAVEGHLALMAEDGDAIPLPVTSVVDFAEEDREHGVSHCVVEWVQVAYPLSFDLAATV